MEDVIKQQVEVIETLCDYIPKLIKGIEDVKFFFQEGNEQKGYEIVTQVIEGYSWVLEAVELTNSLNQGPLDIEGVVDSVNEMLDGFENRDTLLITDVLVYEIKEQLSTWLNVLSNTYEENKYAYESNY